jgi:hypothetical protein
MVELRDDVVEDFCLNGGMEDGVMSNNSKRNEVEVERVALLASTIS